MSTIQERWEHEGAPAILTPALFELNGEACRLVRDDVTYEESLELAGGNLVSGFVDGSRWVLEDRWFFDDGSRCRML